MIIPIPEPSHAAPRHPVASFWLGLGLKAETLIFLLLLKVLLKRWGFLSLFDVWAFFQEGQCVRHKRARGRQDDGS